MAVMDDEQDSGGLPALAWIAIVALLVIGVFTIVGWVFSLVWTFVRLILLVVVVAGIWAAYRATQRDG